MFERKKNKNRRYYSVVKKIMPMGRYRQATKCAAVAAHRGPFYLLTPTTQWPDVFYTDQRCSD